MMAEPRVAGGLDWLLDDLVSRNDQVWHAVILSRDGLAIGASRSITRDDAEHLSALAAGFQSLARGAGRHFDGGAVRQTIIEMENAFLFVTAAGQGSCLAVLSPSEADVGLIAYEMAMLVKRVGQHMSADPRLSGSDPSPG
jgi:predicted regulator of Ras-like GTPase activity (Roadblock/LC7/MglB family)